MPPIRAQRREHFEDRLKPTVSTPSVEGSPDPREILSTILRAAVIEKDKRTNGGLRFLAAYGSKNLELFYHPDFENFTTIVTTDHRQERQSSETTYVYLAAKRFMMAIAEKKGIVLTYDLVTENEKLVNWAKTTGNILFNWEATQELEPHTAAGKIVYRFTCRIRPITNKQAA